MQHLGKKRQDVRPAPDAKMAKTSLATVPCLEAGMEEAQTQEHTHMLRVIHFALLKVSGSRQEGKATSKLTSHSRPK